MKNEMNPTININRKNMSTTHSRATQRPPTPNRLAVIAGIALAFFAFPRATQASCTTGRAVLVGQLPDLFFTPGVTATQTPTALFQNISSSTQTSCGIYAASTMSGVAVVNTYGQKGSYEAYPPEATGVAIAVTYPKTVSTTMRIKVRSDAPAGAGAINIYERTCGDICYGLEPNSNTFDQVYPDRLRLIGTINVYISNQSLHTASVVTEQPVFGSTSTNFVAINNSLTNYNKDARLLITPNYNPGGAGGVYNNHATGVFMGAPSSDGRSTGMWAVYNEDSAVMNNNTSFNIRVTGQASFTHVSTSSNIVGNWTIIDNPICNDNPSAVLLVTHNYSGTSTPMKHNHQLGVWYTNGRWAIFNQDRTAMSAGLAFTVQAFGYPGDGVFVQSATSTNTFTNVMTIDNVRTSGNPNGVVLVTPNYSVGSTYVYPPIGVYYDTYRQRWAVFTQDRSSMPVGAAFNVLVF